VLWITGNVNLSIKFTEKCFLAARHSAKKLSVHSIPWVLVVTVFPKVLVAFLVRAENPAAQRA
jgi:hypothetical protein